MSIASQIYDLQTNLASAKEAVVDKGGAVGDTGLAGLSEEIAAIPGGGGEEDYGTVTYTDSNNQSQTVSVTSPEDYMTLGQYSASSQSNPAIINGVTIDRSAITAVSLGPSATWVPYSFLWGASNLTSLTGTSRLARISGYFLGGCTSFNSVLDLSNVVEVEDRFLSNCSAYNQPISLPKATELGEYFLAYCSSFNNSISIPLVTEIGNSFLAKCTSYNQTLPSLSITHINNSFLSGCSSFNQAISLSGVTVIESYFMQNCTSFNKALSLPNITTIGSQFMIGCTAFAQSLTMPSSLTSANTYFMHNCNSFTGPLVCEGPSAAGGVPSGNYSLSTTNSSAVMYVTGVTVTGTNKNLWKNKLGNRTSSPYRKLILGE